MSFSLCKHPAECPYTEIIVFNHVLTFFVKNTHIELHYNFIKCKIQTDNDTNGKITLKLRG